MRSNKRKILTLSFLSISFLHASEESNSFNFKLYEDFSLSFTSAKSGDIAGSSDNGLNVGLHGAFLWDKKGFSIGLDYSNWNSKFSNINVDGILIPAPKLSASFVDFPLNYIYEIQNGSTSVDLFIGPYVGVPIRDALMKNQIGSVNIGLKTMYGATIKVYLLWKLSPDKDFGFNIFYKRSLSDLTSEIEGNQSYSLIGSGFAIRFN